MSDPKIGSRSGALRALLAGGASALAFLSVVPTAAHAQDASQASDTEAAEEDQIVVVGIRPALRSALAIKRDADTVVDTITATDIGAFPDHSVAEALQRVPGITVTRFASSNDTTHFSAEPSTVIVRGLPQVRSEFNGRDSFNANSSRGLSFADVSPELMAGVDTYKNQTADLIEGGIAGTINLRTRVPFDTDGTLFAFSASSIYRDLPEEATPALSGIWSDRWDTRAGEFGLMANAAYSTEVSTTEGVQLWRFYRVDGVYSPGTNWFPGGADMRRTEYDRERTGLAFAAQWESPEDTLLATLQFNRSQYNNSFEERSLTAITGDSQQRQDVVLTSAVGTTPTGADPYEFDSQGVFTRGTIADDANNWAGDPFNPAFQHPNGFGGNQAWFCYNWSEPTCPTTRGIAISADTRFNDNESITQDASFNLRWTPTDRLSFNFDIQRIDSEVHNFDNSTSSKTFGNLFLDIRGEHPRIGLTPSAGVPLTAGGFADPRNYFHEWTMEHFEDSEGTELAVRADAEYSFDTDWIESLRIGVRRAEREQDVKWSTYNWGSVAPMWGVPAGVGFFVTQPPWNGMTVEGHNLGSNILGGGVFNGGVFMHPRMSIVRDYASTIATFDGNSNDWVPLAQRGCIEDPGSLYCPSELLEVTENTNAAYIRLDFGGSNARIGGMEVRGNIGVRYVETEVVSAGAVQFPLITVPGDCDPDPPAVPAEQCVINPDDLLFGNEGFFSDTGGSETEHWLPSFNLRLGLTEDQYLRFAISRALARPDMGLYKNFIGIGEDDPSCLNTTYAPACAPGQVAPSDTQVPISYSPTYSADIGNPNLAPTTADQVDLTYEWYFSDVGFFSVALFYKQFYDYIQNTNITREFTNNGVTRTVELRMPLNGEGASLQGVEVAFQTFFDFLPDPWSNFGIQANVTYVENEGVSNPNLSNTGSGGSASGESSFIAFTGLPLEGMSDWAYNIVGMYESDQITARLAYNWRSEFLASQADCCIKLPIWQEAYGQLDGSIQYRFNDRLALTFEAQNILDEETVLTQQLNQEGLRAPRSWFINGRRFELRMRYQM